MEIKNVKPVINDRSG